MKLILFLTIIFTFTLAAQDKKPAKPDTVATWKTSVPELTKALNDALKYQEGLPQKYSDALKQEQLYTQGRIDFLRQMLSDSAHIKQPELKKP